MEGGIFILLFKLAFFILLESVVNDDLWALAILGLTNDDLTTPFFCLDIKIVGLLEFKIECTCLSFLLEESEEILDNGLVVVGFRWLRNDEDLLGIIACLSRDTASFDFVFGEEFMDDKIGRRRIFFRIDFCFIV